jgi:hypothetical protein
MVKELIAIAPPGELMATSKVPDDPDEALEFTTQVFNVAATAGAWQYRNKSSAVVNESFAREPWRLDKGRMRMAIFISPASN